MRTPTDSPVLIVIRDGDITNEPNGNFTDSSTGWWNRMILPNGVRVVWSNDMDSERANLKRSITGLGGFTAFVTLTDGRVVSALVSRATTTGLSLQWWDPENGVDIGGDVFNVPMSDIDTIYIP